MLFLAGGNTEADDFRNMDGGVLMASSKMRLLQAICREMILALDNAAHQHGAVSGWKSPPKATKALKAALSRNATVDTTSLERHGGSHDFAVPERVPSPQGLQLETSPTV